MSVLYFIAPPLPYYINSGETVFKPGDVHPSRSVIGLFDMLVVSQGTLYMGEEDQNWDVREGHLLILRPDRSHYSPEPVGSDTRFYWLHFHTAGSWSDQSGYISSPETASAQDRYRLEQGFVLQPFQFGIPQYMKLNSPESVYTVLRDMNQLSRQPGAPARWEQQSLLHRLLNMLAEQQEPVVQSSALQLAEQVAVYLRTHYRQPISNSMLQREFNFHPVYIARCMSKAYGCSTMEYLARFRFEQAKLLLLNTNFPIERIASECGFQHQTYFSNMFRRQENMSPSAFRKHFSWKTTGYEVKKGKT